MFIKNKKAFTLVELIIVVTILAILATVAFLSFGDYPSQARDSVRILDLNTIEKTLELYKIENGEYPATEELTEEEKAKNQGKKFVGFTEGKIGENLGKILKFGKTPTDPLTGDYYSYSVSDDKQIYVLKINLENGGEKIVGDIPINCEDLKSKNKFIGNGTYTVFHENIEPRQVYCHENYKETFQLSSIGGDMEVILGNNENNQKYATFYEGSFDNGKTITTFSTEEKFSGERSLKIEGAGNIVRSDYIYIDPTKNYKFSLKAKVLEKNKVGNSKSGIVISLNFSSLVDGEIKQIEPKYKNIVLGSETILARDLRKTDKIVYFECNQDIYNLWKKNLNVSTSIAFDVDMSGEQKDLPNKKVSSIIGRWLHPTYGNVNGFLTVEGGTNWTNKDEIKICALHSHFDFGVTYSAGTTIRHHFGNSNNINAIYRKFYGESDWITIEGIIPKERLGKLDNFAKFDLKANYNPRYENGKTEIYNENTITYIDDFKLEVID